jgi:hypothetical protein
MCTGGVPSDRRGPCDQIVWEAEDEIVVSSFMRRSMKNERVGGAAGGGHPSKFDGSTPVLN